MSNLQNIQFGNIEIVEKTFTRTGGIVRVQQYHGFKYRRALSKRKGDEEDTVREIFVVSNTAYNQMNLDTLALTHAKHGDNVLLLVLEDQDNLKPPAKIMKRKMSKEGEPLKKGKSFSNEFLSKDLEDIGVLTPGQMGNQYIAIVDVTQSIGGLPEHVKAVFQLIKDETAVDNGEEEDENESENESESEVVNSTSEAPNTQQEEF